MEESQGGSNDAVREKQGWNDPKRIFQAADHVLINSYTDADAYTRFCAVIRKFLQLFLVFFVFFGFLHQSSSCIVHVSLLRAFCSGIESFFA
jgi:hypothetical protein